MELVQSKITRDLTTLRGGNTERLSNSYINRRRTCGSFTTLSNSERSALSRARKRSSSGNEDVSDFDLSNAGNDSDCRSNLSPSLYSSTGNKRDSLENSIMNELDDCALEE